MRHRIVKIMSNVE